MVSCRVVARKDRPPKYPGSVSIMKPVPRSVAARGKKVGGDKGYSPYTIGYEVLPMATSSYLAQVVSYPSQFVQL